MSEKIAWVIPGGGSRSAYTAGLVYAASRKLKKPDIIITASGGVGASCYYLAEQIDYVKEIWLKYVTLKEFAHVYRFWKFADIDFLIDQVFKRAKQLNIQKVIESDVRMYVAVNNYATGIIEFFTNKDSVDLWEVMRATKKAPVFSGLRYNPVKIKDNYYGDSRVTSHCQLLIKKALEEGATKIIVFDNYHEWSSFVSGDLMFKMWLLFRNKTFRQRQLQYLKQMNNFQIPKDKQIFIIKPSKRLRIVSWSNNKKDLTKVFTQAINDFENFYLKNTNVL